MSADPARRSTRTGALQNAILKSAELLENIATDEKGVIQIFNVGAERMLGYAAVDVVNKITPAEISDPQEVIARANGPQLQARHEDPSRLPGSRIQGLSARGSRRHLQS